MNSRRILFFRIKAKRKIGSSACLWKLYLTVLKAKITYFIFKKSCFRIVVNDFLKLVSVSNLLNIKVIFVAIAIVIL